MASINEITDVLIKIIRAVIIVRIIWCLIILMAKSGENNNQLINRTKHIVLAWIIAESIKQFIAIIQNYYKG